LIVPVIKRVREKEKTTLPRIFVGDCKPAVKVGQDVSETDVIAHCEVSAGRRLIKISSALGVGGREARKYLLRNEGDRIYEGEIIARKKSLFGITNTEVKAPIDGQIVSIDDVGDLMVKFMPKPVRMIAAAQGQIKEISEDRITISTIATIVKAVAALGKEMEGTISILAGAEDFILPSLIKAEDRGKILVGGAAIQRASLEKAVTLGVSGIITGGMDKRDFDNLGASGESLIAVLVVEGFGNLPLGNDILEFLKKKEGRPALIVPQEKSLILPESDSLSAKEVVFTPWRQLKIGDKVRFYKEEGHGLLGEVKEILGEQILNSGILAEAVKVKLESGEEIPLPAANLEVIE